VFFFSFFLLQVVPISLPVTLDSELFTDTLEYPLVTYRRGSPSFLKKKIQLASFFIELHLTECTLCFTRKKNKAILAHKIVASKKKKKMNTIPVGRACFFLSV
jgi:hypothetical protein